MRGRKSDERHDLTHLDGVRGGPLAVDQQHVVWRELELANGVGDLDDARALLRGGWGRTVHCRVPQYFPIVPVPVYYHSLWKRGLWLEGTVAVVITVHSTM